MLLLASPGETPYEQPVLHSRLRGIAEAFKAKIIKTARHLPKSSLLCLHRQPSVPVNLSHKDSHFWPRMREEESTNDDDEEDYTLWRGKRRAASAGTNHTTSRLFGAVR